MVATASVPAGVGLGWRRELAAPLLTAAPRVDFVEVIAESCFKPGPIRREVEGLAEIWPVLPHGIKLSLGSADGIDDEHARKLGQLARRLRSPLVSEHVAFTRGQRTDIGHLTQLPLHRTAVAVVARNLARARRHLPDIPVLLENPAWTLRWSDDEMDEGTFFHEIVHATGCELLLDIANLYANATNSGQDPRALLHSYPLNRVAMVHIAGGAWRDGFYVDTHCHATPPSVFDLLADLIRIRGPVPIVLERDGRYPPFAELGVEITNAQRILQSGQDLATATTDDTGSGAAQSAHRSAAVRADSPQLQALTALATQQGQLAALLTQPFLPDSSLRHDNEAADAAERTGAQMSHPAWDAQALHRSRSVLLHKRVDEAIALLGRTRSAAQAQRIDLYALALEALASQAPAQRLPTVVDALSLARWLQSHASLSVPARLDQLALQARFTEQTQGAAPRFLPYLARAQHQDGGHTWVFKPPGRQSILRFFRRPPALNRGGVHTRSP